jgi:hypothetical protein
MSSNGDMDRDAAWAAFDVLDAALNRVMQLDYSALSTGELWWLLERIERVRRKLSTPPPAVMAAAAAKAVYGTAAASCAMMLNRTFASKRARDVQRR